MKKKIIETIHEFIECYRLFCVQMLFLLLRLLQRAQNSNDNFIDFSVVQKMFVKMFCFYFYSSSNTVNLLEKQNVRKTQKGRKKERKRKGEKNKQNFNCTHPKHTHTQISTNNMYSINEYLLLSLLFSFPFPFFFNVKIIPLNIHYFVFCFSIH